MGPLLVKKGENKVGGGVANVFFFSAFHFSAISRGMSLL